MKLHVGCEYVLMPGWINADIKNEWPMEKKGVKGLLELFNFKIMDATKPWEYEDNSLDLIYSEHLIEHLSYEGAKTFVKEAYRTLKPGGTIRTAWPDLNFLIELFHNPEKYPEYIKVHCDLFHPELIEDFGIENIPVSYVISDHFKMWGHQIMYSMNDLIKLFNYAGFTNIRQCNFGESEIPELMNVEHANNKMGKASEDIVRLETSIIECTK